MLLPMGWIYELKLMKQLLVFRLSNHIIVITLTNLDNNHFYYFDKPQQQPSKELDHFPCKKDAKSASCQNMYAESNKKSLAIINKTKCNFRIYSILHPCGNDVKTLTLYLRRFCVLSILLAWMNLNHNIDELTNYCNYEDLSMNDYFNTSHERNPINNQLHCKMIDDHDICGLNVLIATKLEAILVNSSWIYELLLITNFSWNVEIATNLTMIPLNISYISRRQSILNMSCDVWANIMASEISLPERHELNNHTVFARISNHNLIKGDV